MKKTKLPDDFGKWPFTDKEMEELPVFTIDPSVTLPQDLKKKHKDSQLIDATVIKINQMASESLGRIFGLAADKQIRELLQIVYNAGKKHSPK